MGKICFLKVAVQTIASPEGLAGNSKEKMEMIKTQIAM